MTTPNRRQEQRQRSHARLRKAQRTAFGLAAATISAMMLLAAVGLSTMARSFSWPITSNVFVPFIGLMALETLHARQVEKRIWKKYASSGLFRLAEFLLLAIVLRISLLLWGNADGQWAVFTAHIARPLAAWFVPEFNLSVFLLFLLWVFMLFAHQDLTLLFNLQEFTDWDQVGKHHADLAKIRAAFLTKFTFLGMAVLIGMIFSAGAWDQTKSLLFSFHGESLRLILVVMGYFLLLLLLMSQTQLARLRTRWWINAAFISPRIHRDWVRVSLIFFLVAALAALIAPSGFAEGLFRTMQKFLLYVMMALQLIFSLVMVPIALLLGWLFPQPSGSTETPVPVQPEVPQEAVQPFLPQIPAWLDTLSAVLVWLVLGGVILFALLQYLRQDRNLFADVRSLLQRIGAFLRDAWRSLRTGIAERLAERKQQLSYARNPVTVDEENNQERLPTAPDRTRHRIFQLYRHLLQHAQQAGIHRKASQTPLDYEQALDGYLDSGVADSLHGMTEKFDDARYSQRAMSDEDARQMAEDWESVRQELHKRGS